MLFKFHIYSGGVCEEVQVKKHKSENKINNDREKEGRI